jgi:hypothetical protein
VDYKKFITTLKDFELNSEDLYSGGTEPKKIKES